MTANVQAFRLVDESGAEHRAFRIRVPVPYKAVAMAREVNEELGTVPEIERKFEALAEREDATPSDLLAVHEEAQRTFCGLYGLLLGQVLDGFQRPPRPREMLPLQWGMQCYEQLYDAGWSAEHIAAAYAEAMKLVAAAGNSITHAGSPNLSKVRAIQDFGEAPPESPISS